MSPTGSSGVTSCGLPIAILKTSVAYCCGTFLVLVVPATVAKKSKSLLAPVTSAGKKGKYLMHQLIHFYRCDRCFSVSCYCKP